MKKSKKIKRNLEVCMFSGLTRFARSLPRGLGFRVFSAMGTTASRLFWLPDVGGWVADTPGMRERFPLFVKAIREAYPEIKIIGTSGLGAAPCSSSTWVSR